jgi:hypothetical protein
MSETPFMTWPFPQHPTPAVQGTKEPGTRSTQQTLRMRRYELATGTQVRYASEPQRTP